MGMGGMPLVGLVGWGFMLGCSDTVGSLQLESHHSWLARGVPFGPFCALCFTPVLLKHLTYPFLVTKN